MGHGTHNCGKQVLLEGQSASYSSGQFHLVHKVVQLFHESPAEGDLVGRAVDVQELTVLPPELCVEAHVIDHAQ